jgi:hypothetical protein
VAQNPQKLRRLGTRKRTRPGNTSVVASCTDQGAGDGNVVKWHDNIVYSCLLSAKAYLVGQGLSCSPLTPAGLLEEETVSACPGEPVSIHPLLWDSVALPMAFWVEKGFSPAPWGRKWKERPLLPQLERRGKRPPCALTLEFGRISASHTIPLIFHGESVKVTSPTANLPEMEGSTTQIPCPRGKVPSRNTDTSGKTPSGNSQLSEKNTILLNVGKCGSS